ncbi:AbfB domain-containing protein [Actinoplanes palleronii]|uniref:Alpha-L-arabinofuranosidase B arabinose-binding domain-containing protein n=1 Tax=Actinoplanes palleronii TaxID=113570 RepID=A0ABQ4BI28_9ACTN|nr:AbfB domain-containing protein [Actinoplanes palleronii]GIE70340.1 hypothetical protein Apa02nite_064480 [Actinoplanes palleronii]
MGMPEDEVPAGVRAGRRNPPYQGSRRSDGPLIPRGPLLALAGAVTLTLIGYAVVLGMVRGPGDDDPVPAVAEPYPTLPRVSPPVSVGPAPSRSPESAPYTPTRRPASSRPVTATTATSAGPAPSLPVLPVVGTTVGLSPAGDPTRRVRHRDAVARLDTISATSSTTDRSDSRFVVRAGRSDPACVSFEAAGVPGTFLRHQSFVIRLAAPDGTALFQQDATFCPVARGTGFVLRSTNYPSLHMHVSGDELRLEEAATVFRTVAPL